MKINENDITKILADLPEIELPEGFHDEVMQKIKEAAPSIPARAKRRPLVRYIGLLVAAAALVFIVVAVLDFGIAPIGQGGGMAPVPFAAVAEAEPEQWSAPEAQLGVTAATPAPTAAEAPLMRGAFDIVFDNNFDDFTELEDSEYSDQLDESPIAFGIAAAPVDTAEMQVYGIAEEEIYDTDTEEQDFLFAVAGAPAPPVGEIPMPSAFSPVPVDDAGDFDYSDLLDTPTVAFVGGSLEEQFENAGFPATIISIMPFPDHLPTDNLYFNTDYRFVITFEITILVEDLAQATQALNDLGAQAPVMDLRPAFRDLEAIFIALYALGDVQSYTMTITDAWDSWEETNTINVIFIE